LGIDEHASSVEGGIKRMNIIRTPTKFDNFFVGWILVLMLWFAGSIPAYSQVVGGILSGTVTDESGAAVPKAAVSIANVSTGVTTNVTTNAQGIYDAPNLLPGNYQVTVSASGFETVVESGIILTVGAQQVLNVPMKVGSVTEKVEVTGEAPDVQLASPTISGVISSNTIVELPLNGRSWTDLATLQPGISSIHAIVSVSDTGRLGRGLGNELSISGARPGQNTYLLDGININDYSNQAPGSILGGNLGADAVEEFTVLTTNYSTEYGRTSGGVVSGITRSGTNDFHGSAYEFLRNSALDARNHFDLASIPAFRRNQFGASAGGPIRKDKTFIFADYEGLRQNLGLSEQDIVPSLTARSGYLCTPPDCATTTFVGVNPQVQPYLKFYPLPNGPEICPCTPAGTADTANYSFAGAQITSENYFTTRVDQHFSNKDTLTGSYMYDKAPSSQNDEFNNKLIFSQTRRQLVTLEETHLFSSSLVNTIRLGFNNIFASAPDGGTAINPLAADTSLGFLPGLSVGQIHFPGVTNFSGGVIQTEPAVFHYHDFQIYDNVFLTKGIHSLKFGANVEQLHLTQFGNSSVGGLFLFNSLQDFLTNRPNAFSADGPVTITKLRETLFGAYLQDDIRLRPNLTINAGLRYEMATVPHEIHGIVDSLYSLTSSKVYTGNPLFANPSLRDFEPRVGFSWDPFRTGKTAVRGGFGMFDVQILPASLGSTLAVTPPFHQSYSGTNLPAFSFPTGAFASLSVSTTGLESAFLQRKPPRNYVMQWNVNIQREIAPNTTAMIAYVGSRGVHNLFNDFDASIVLPVEKTPLGYLWPIPNTGPPDGLSPWPVLNPNWGAVHSVFWTSDSVFHALEAQLTKRMSHGLEAQLSYTYERSIDSSSGTTDGDQFQNGISSLFFFDSRLRRGPSDFNVPQTLSASYTWDIPGPKGATGVLGWASSGWELGGILQANSGTPFTPLVGPDPLGVNSSDPFDYPDFVHGCNPIHGGVNYLNVNCFSLPLATGPVAGKCSPFGAFASPTAPIPGTCANLMGNAGRNSLVGPRLIDFDMSLFKDNPVKRISEAFNAQFRIEMFNVLNHSNFNPPVGNFVIFDGNGVGVPGAGQITSTATTSRQIQFALKVIW
jgi:outer membrane receptor protein involved in Fe transport